MPEFDELEIRRQEAPPPPPKPGSSRSRLLAAGGIVVALALAGGLIYFLVRIPDEPDRTPPTVEDMPDPQSPVSPEVPPEEPEEPLPPLDASDEAVRRWVGLLSSRPELAEWLTSEHLIRRFTVAVVNLAEGKSPRTHLPFLAPEEPFQVVERDDRLYIASGSYRRYDRLAAVLASLDTQGTARLYRRLKPLIQEAYWELGYPGEEFDLVLAAAIREVLAVPSLEAEIELVEEVTSYRYADPRLEELSPARKQLLRMGPENLRRIQAKLRDLADALE